MALVGSALMLAEVFSTDSAYMFTSRRIGLNALMNCSAGLLASCAKCKKKVLWWQYESVVVFPQSRDKNMLHGS